MNRFFANLPCVFWHFLHVPFIPNRSNDDELTNRTRLSFNLCQKRRQRESDNSEKVPAFRRLSWSCTKRWSCQFVFQKHKLFYYTNKQEHASVIVYDQIFMVRRQLKLPPSFFLLILGQIRILVRSSSTNFTSLWSCLKKRNREFFWMNPGLETNQKEEKWDTTVFYTYWIPWIWKGIFYIGWIIEWLFRYILIHISSEEILLLALFEFSHHTRERLFSDWSSGEEFDFLPWKQKSLSWRLSHC